VDKALQRFAHPGTKQAMKVERAEAGDSRQLFQIKRFGEMALNVIDHPVHPSGIFLACGF